MTYTFEKASEGKIWAVEDTKFDGTNASKVTEIDIRPKGRTSSGGYAPTYPGLETGLYLGHNASTGHYILSDDDAQPEQEDI